MQFLIILGSFGFMIGPSPIIGCNYGIKNDDLQKNIFKKSIIFMGITIISIILLCFIFSGFGIFGSSMFTALYNGLFTKFFLISRPLIFQIITILTLVLLFGFNSIWLSFTVVDIFSALTTIIFFIYF